MYEKLYREIVIDQRIVYDTATQPATDIVSTVSLTAIGIPPNPPAPELFATTSGTSTELGAGPTLKAGPSCSVFRTAVPLQRAPNSSPTVRPPDPPDLPTSRHS
jgi:hypothetical protein